MYGAHRNDSVNITIASHYAIFSLSLSLLGFETVVWSSFINFMPQDMLSMQSTWDYLKSHLKSHHMQLTATWNNLVDNPEQDIHTFTNWDYAFYPLEIYERRRNGLTCSATAYIIAMMQGKQQHTAIPIIHTNNMQETTKKTSNVKNATHSLSKPLR